MNIGKTNMNEHHDRTTGVKETPGFDLVHPDDVKHYYREERAAQTIQVIPVDMAAFRPIVHTETIPHVAAPEKKTGPSHRLGEKPKLIASLTDAAKRGLDAAKRGL